MGCARMQVDIKHAGSNELRDVARERGTFDQAGNFFIDHVSDAQKCSERLNLTWHDLTLHPFTPVRAIPSTNCFWKNMKRTINGIVVRFAAASMTAVLVLY